MKQLCLIALLPLWAAQAQINATDINVGGLSFRHGAGAPVNACNAGDLYTQTGASAGQNGWSCIGGSWIQQVGAAAAPGGIPAGAILLIVSGTCPSGFAEETSLSGKTLFGTLAANADVGATGGADSITPAGTSSAPGFTGNSATLAHTGTAVNAHSGTAVANHSFTQPTAAWPVGVPTNSGGAVDAHSGAAVNAHSATAVADHAAHTHTFTQSSNAATPDLLTSLATGAAVAASGTTGNPSATLTHSVTQPANHVVTQPSNHVFTQPTVTWPVGVPINSGGAVDAHAVTQPSAHTVTQPNDHSYTPAGTVAAPTFTGNSFDNRSAFVKVIFCRKS